MNAAVGQITWVKCVLLESTAVQIAQVTIRVPPIHVQYIFNMPVSTDCHQSVNVNLRILSLNCQSWNTAKSGISRLLDFYKIGIFVFRKHGKQK